MASSEFHREGDLALAKTCPTRTITVAYQLHLSRFTGKAAYSMMIVEMQRRLARGLLHG
jgi:hypothetical protein